MSLTGNLDKTVYYDGVPLIEGRRYKWSGRIEKLYNIVSWDCDMKIVKIEGDTIYIISYDDKETSMWNIEGFERNRVKIKKKNQPVFSILKGIIIIFALAIFIVSIPFIIIGAIGLLLVLLSRRMGLKFGDEDYDTYASGPFRGMLKL